MRTCSSEPYLLNSSRKNCSSELLERSDRKMPPWRGANQFSSFLNEVLYSQMPSSTMMRGSLIE